MSLITFLKNFKKELYTNNDEKIKSLRKELYARTISLREEKITCEVSEKNPSGIQTKRVVLKTNVDHCKFKLQCQFDANGVVIDFETLNILAYNVPNYNPNGTLNKFIQTATIYSNLLKKSDYSIYPILDGSVVVLYYYEGAWCIASGKSYDISDYQWFHDSLTYRSALDELLASYSDFSYDKLDKNMSYSLCFKHNKFHLYQATQYVSVIGAYQLNILNKYINDIDDDITGVMDLHVAPKILPVQIGLPEQTAIDVSFADLKNVDKFKNCFGFIIRCDHPAFGHNMHIAVKSRLYNHINSAIYDFSAEEKKKLTTPSARLTYVILRNILNVRYTKKFAELFPQFNGIVFLYKQLLDIAVKRIVLKNRLMRSIEVDVATSELVANLMSSYSAYADRVSAIVDEFNGQYDKYLAQSDRFEEEESIMRDVICDIQNIDTILAIFCE